MVLVTSRRRLAGLTARDGARTLVLDTLTEADAERVIESAQAPLTEQARKRLLQLCGRLPLALRIIAARLFGGTPISVERVLAELEDEHSRLGALRVEGTDTSVRAVLDVSHGRLPATVARTFAELGAFPGAWIGPHELAAMGELTLAQAYAHLLELNSANLVVEQAPGRFGMHELVRLFARECAGALTAEQRENATRRLVRYYLVVADIARRQLRPAFDGRDLAALYGEVAAPRIDGPQQALDWFEAQWPNLLAVQGAAVGAGMHGEARQVALVADAFRMARPLADGWSPVVDGGAQSLVRPEQRV
jgi:hypothetical protein